MTDFSKILEKAKELEKKMKESQEAIKKIEVIGNSGGDLVKVKLNGEGVMISVEISDKLLNEEKNIIEDLIKAAHNSKIFMRPAWKLISELGPYKKKQKMNLEGAREIYNRVINLPSSQSLIGKIK